jgi:hypothetical protein
MKMKYFAITQLTRIAKEHFIIDITCNKQVMIIEYMRHGYNGAMT